MHRAVAEAKTPSRAATRSSRLGPGGSTGGTRYCGSLRIARTSMPPTIGPASFRPPPKRRALTLDRCPRSRKSLPLIAEPHAHEDARGAARGPPLSAGRAGAAGRGRTQHDQRPPGQARGRRHRGGRAPRVQRARGAARGSRCCAGARGAGPGDEGRGAPAASTAVNRRQAMREVCSRHDHLAGRAGIAVADMLLDHGALEDRDGTFLVPDDARALLRRHVRDRARSTPGAAPPAGPRVRRIGPSAGPMSRARWAPRCLTRCLQWAGSCAAAGSARSR